MDEKETIIEAEEVSPSKKPALEPKEPATSSTSRSVGIFVFLLFGLLVAVIIWGTLDTQEATFDYRGVEFTHINDELIPYKVSFDFPSTDPLTGAVTKIPANYYIRNDPLELQETIPFTGEWVIPKTMVLGAESSFNCDGQGILGMTNLIRFYTGIGIETIRDEDIGCDSSPYASYQHWYFLEGERNAIKRVAPHCFEVTVNNCEILPTLERIMIEGFVKTQEMLDKE